jgi:subtilisin-like proprotein convertase family protein
MGSAALDRQGNLAVGFSVSDAVVFPGIRYGGRLASDPPGGLAQGEATIIAGSRVQTSTGARWGDYSSLNVDPVDDCTFWFTTEYYGTAPPTCGSATQCWQTRTASFKFPSCTAAPAAGTITGTVTNAANGNPVVGAMITAGNGYIGVTNASGVYAILLPPQTIDVTATGPGYSTQNANGVVVPTGASVTRNFVLAGVPALSAPTQSFSDAGPGGNNNGVIDVQECPVVTADASNTGGGNATATTGVLSTTTPNVTVTAANASYGTVGPGTTAPGTPPYVIRTGAAFEPGQPIELSLLLTATEGTWTQTFSFPTGTPANSPAPFSASGPVAIPDNNATGAVLPIVVAGLTSRVSKVTVSFRVTHTFQGDLSFQLLAPDGTAVGLVQNLGGSGSSSANVGTDCPAGANDLTFDDAAAASIVGAPGAANFSGTFRPAQPLSALQGKVGNGTWQLRAIDNAGQDVGTIDCATVTIDGFSSTSAGCGVALPDPMFQDGFESP